MPAEEYSEILRVLFDENGEAHPHMTDAFSAEELPGWSDGDYPPWLQQEMEQVVPEEVLRQFGHYETSVLNGPFWFIPKKNLEGIFSALRAMGWELESAQAYAVSLIQAQWFWAVLHFVASDDRPKVIYNISIVQDPGGAGARMLVLLSNVATLQSAVFYRFSGKFCQL